MTEGKENRPPKIYAIWVEARPESPMAGLSGFLSENGQRLFFTECGSAKQKLWDMEALRLNRHPAVKYQCVEYPGGHDIERSVQAELIKALDTTPDPGVMRYAVIDRIYGNTGCNSLTGELKADNGKINLDNMGSTRMMCADMTNERKVLEALGKVKGYEIDAKGNLLLTNAQGKEVILLVKKK